MEGIEVPMSVFMEYTKVPIVIYYGDNLPETDERPELYEWTRRLYLMKIWAKMLNGSGWGCHRYSFTGGRITWQYPFPYVGFK